MNNATIQEYGVHYTSHPILGKKSTQKLKQNFDTKFDTKIKTQKIGAKLSERSKTIVIM